MLMRRFLGPIAALALLAACGDTPTAPQPLEVSGASFAVVGQGQGAIVDHFSNGTLLLLTRDSESDLYSVHYTDSDFDLPPCVPAFHGAMKSGSVTTPNGNAHNQDSGEVYVIVNRLSGFPGNLCDEPLAEGTIRLQVAVNRGPPGATVASFVSNGWITDNSDGGEVRLHHVRKGVQGPPDGTVQLR